MYFEKTFHGDWGMKMSQSSFGQFHYLTRGRCVISLSNPEDKIEMSSGDVILFPFGLEHSLSNHSDCQLLSGMDVYNAHIKGESILDEGPENAELICGHYSFDTSYLHPFIQSLPDYIFIRGNQKNTESIRRTAANISSELESPNPGSTALIQSYAEVLFIQIIRHYSNVK